MAAQRLLLSIGWIRTATHSLCKQLTLSSLPVFFFRSGLVLLARGLLPDFSHAGAPRLHRRAAS
jgi:hypothetical protein